MATAKVILNGTTLMDVTQKTVTSANMLNGITALKNDGTDITGSYTAPSGTKQITISSAGTTTEDVTNYASAEITVGAGTEGTPTATKGAVSNHAISVTPSVTNTAGYISGGTKTGTAVSVSASELVSGTYSVTGSGTKDVTNYASISVPSGSATTPATSVTATPTISVSSGGLITASVSTTKSVTPTVSAGYVSSGTAGTVTVSGSNTSQLTTQAAQTITPTTSDQTIASGKYLTGTQTIKGDANLVAWNIKKDVSIFGVTGTYEGGGGGGGITVTNYSMLGDDSIDFSGSASDLFSVSSGGMTIATVPIFIEEDSEQYQFTCFYAEEGDAFFGSFGGGIPIFAEFYFFDGVMALGGVTMIDGTSLTAHLDDTEQMTVYSV